MTSNPSLPSLATPPDSEFEIGWDFAHYRLVTSAEKLPAGNLITKSRRAN